MLLPQRRTTLPDSTAQFVLPNWKLCVLQRNIHTHRYSYLHASLTYIYIYMCREKGRGGGAEIGEMSAKLVRLYYINV